MNRPIFFKPNRVWRCYRGGRLLDEFTGITPPSDSHFPEEWLASTTKALNGPNKTNPDEGLSIVSDSNISLKSLIDSPPPVLCKYLDSAERLPIQCHPDRSFAKKFYNSSVGKAESWFILRTRKINGEKPYLLMGFKENVVPGDFREAVLKQDIPALTTMLHKVEVKAGDAFFIPGRFPHAIGPGVFMLEVQEPSDWVVQPERFIGDTRLSDTDMWGPLDVETGLSCFDFNWRGDLEHILEKVRLVPERIGPPSPGCTVERFVTSERSGSFTVDRVTITMESRLQPLPCHSICVVAGGSAGLMCGGFQDTVKRGDCFMIPRGQAPVFTAREPLTFYLIFA